MQNGRVWMSCEQLSVDLELYRKNHEAAFGFSPVVVITSGGFDCLHIGHVRCLQQSSRFGDRVIVVVNGDDFLHRKKGYALMTIQERLEIISSISGVDDVVSFDDGTQFVAGALEILKPDVFTKGGDRSSPAYMATAELEVCERIGCRIEYGVGGTDKIQSSSWLRTKWVKTNAGS